MALCCKLLRQSRQFEFNQAYIEIFTYVDCIATFAYNFLITAGNMTAKLYSVYTISKGSKYKTPTSNKVKDHNFVKHCNIYIYIYIYIIWTSNVTILYSNR